MRLDCTTPKYDGLYARWLSDPGSLLDLAGFDPSSDRLLDLCGGTGAVSLEALRRGAESVLLYDLSPRCRDARVIQRQGRAEELSARLLTSVAARTFVAFDVVVCRQAVGYLDIGPAFEQVARVMAPAGRFAFNTFRRPRWSARAYRHGGRLFLEASGWAGRRVVHLQASPGVGVDVTSFRWHTEDEVMAALDPWFIVTSRSSEKSVRWLCVRRAQETR